MNQQPQILTVEDDAPIRRGIVDALRLPAISHSKPRTGDEGLKLALQRSFDLILLDLVLHGVMGWRFSKLSSKYAPINRRLF